MRRLTRRGITAAGIIFAASLATGCYSVEDNVPETVYGPPHADAESTDAGTSDAGTADAGDVPASSAAGGGAAGAAVSEKGAGQASGGTQSTGDGAPDGFDVWDNVLEDVYGPPEDLS